MYVLWMYVCLQISFYLSNWLFFQTVNWTYTISIFNYSMFDNFHPFGKYGPSQKYLPNPPMFPTSYRKYTQPYNFKLSCTHLYHFFLVSIHSLQCIHWLFQLDVQDKKWYLLCLCISHHPGPYLPAPRPSLPLSLYPFSPYPVPTTFNP